jgi:hypothetical protein
MTLRRTAAAAAACLAGALAAPAAASAAEAFYATTTDNLLVSFQSDSPGAVRDAVELRGLQPGERIVGLDVRPQLDILIALANSGRVYQVNTTTGAMRPLFGGTPRVPPLNGTRFGVDVNPAADALRIVSDTEQNLRVRFSDGTTFADGPLAYAPGDPGAGTNPEVADVAYTNSIPDAPETTLLGIDNARDALVRIEPPNAGRLTTIGPLGVPVQGVVGFDVGSGNVAFALLDRGDGPELFRIDLATGRAAPTAEDAGVDIADDDGDRLTLTSLAAAGQVPDDRERPTVSVAFSSTILEQNTNVLRPSVSCDEACGVIVQAFVGGRRAGQGAAFIQGAGRETVRVPIDATGRRRIARRGTELIRLQITVADAAGNVVRQTRFSRTQTLAGRRAGG